MTDHFRRTAPALIDRGYLVLPLPRGSKAPTLKNWSKARLTAQDATYYPEHGIGIICGQGEHPVIGVDVDISHPTVGPAVLNWCREHLGDTAERVGAAPRILLAYRAAEAGWSKGYSIKFFDPTDPKKPGGKDNMQQVEILASGQQFVAYHEHPDLKREYEWVDLYGGLEAFDASALPVVTIAQITALLREVERLARATPGLQIKGEAKTVDRGAVTEVHSTHNGHNGSASKIEIDGIEFEAANLEDLSDGRVGKSIAECRAMLDAIKNDGLEHDRDYDYWFKVGGALHSEFAGTEHEDAAQDLWRAWGANSPKDDPKQYGYKWKSMGKHGRGVTLRWLIKQYNEAKVHVKYDAVEQWRAEIDNAGDEFALRERVARDIMKDARIDDMGRERLAQLLMKRFNALGTRYPIAQVRKLITPTNGHRRANDKKPEWLEGWVYVTDKDQFFKYDSDQWLSMQGFNACFNREIATDEDGNISKTAAWVALEDYAIPQVTRALYLPWAGDIFDLHGTKAVNTYRPSTVPAAATVITNAGKNAIEIVTRHLDLLCGGRALVRRWLLDWLSHNVQHPGVKIRWTPVIKGVEGDGKTFLSTLMAAVMGRPNVKNVTPKVLGTDFSGWGEGAALVVLEEIKLQGHNRYDILNALKPFIANDSVEIHRKGVDSYDAVNTSNYMAFTNYPDALPLSDTDRRWMVVFTPWATIGDLWVAVRAAGCSPDTYFKVLADAIAQHPAELRAWLLQHRQHADFDPNGRAPDTEEKRSMIGMNGSDEQMAVQEALEKGGYGVTPTLFSSSCMRDLVLGEIREWTLEGKAVNAMYVRMGFTRMPQKVKWRDQAHIIWTKLSLSMTPDQVRQVLTGTEEKHGVPEGLDDFF